MTGSGEVAGGPVQSGGDLLGPAWVAARLVRPSAAMARSRSV